MPFGHDERGYPLSKQLRQHNALLNADVQKWLLRCLSFCMEACAYFQYTGNLKEVNEKTVSKSWFLD